MMSASPFALLLPSESEAMDRAASAVVPVHRLMERAGWAVARAIRRRFAPCRVVVACGPGNNGGDGYVVARFLAQWGWSVRVMALRAPGRETAAFLASEEWGGVTVSFSEKAVEDAELLVDAVFGAGLSREVEEEVASVLRRVPRRVAVDVPSGVCGETGRVLGNAVACELTVTFVRPRPGHFLEPGRSLCGEVVCADIGMPDVAWDAIEPKVFLNWPGLWRLPEFGEGDYKYRRGVVSVCGGATMPGATRLAARAARRTGAGLVRIAAGNAAEAYRLGDPGLVVDDGAVPDLVKDERRRVWVCGPGLMREEVSGVLPELLAAGRMVLADAGALEWGSENLSRLDGVVAMTPHIGEFRKLFGPVGEDRVGAALKAARQGKCVVVLKGSDTIIAGPDGRVAINSHASSALATAGSGDTLAGVIGALLAAGMEVWEACCAGVWLHGEAGIQAGLAHGGWPVAEDLDEPLGVARARATELGKRSFSKNPVTALL